MWVGEKIGNFLRLEKYRARFYLESRNWHVLDLQWDAGWGRQRRRRGDVPLEGCASVVCPQKRSINWKSLPIIRKFFVLFWHHKDFFFRFSDIYIFFGSIITKQVQSVGFCTPGLHILFHKTKIHQLKILFGVHQHYAACLKNQYMFNS